MATSSQSTEQNWDPTSLLAYGTLPNHQDNLDPLISDAKYTPETGTVVYDRSLTSRRYALAGMVCSGVISCCCIIAGIVIIATDKADGASRATAHMTVRLRSNLQKEMLLLMLNLFVILCTESTGFVHGISLRFALASESRLRFNSNLRLLTAARGWSNPNGALLNGTMAVLLILSYSSASLITFSSEEFWGMRSTPSAPITVTLYVAVSILGLPLLLLGVALLLQVVIAWSGMRAVKILTWSSSSFDLTAALIHHTQLTPVPLRCMRAMSNMDVYEGPAKPSQTQPSAWHAHPSIRKIIISLWGLVVACAGWAALVMYFYNTYKSNDSSVITLKSWSFFPNDILVRYGMPLSGSGPWWILSLANVAVFQGPLTFGLHCSELIVNVIRDERHWRCATGRKGLRSATNPLKSVFANPLCLILFVAKPALHWMFGLAFTSSTGIYFKTGGVTFLMYTTQIWNLCITLIIFASFFTLVSLCRPRGPQPAAYGHLQTLANLVDEWSPVMWWGHKEDRVPYCHAGTSDHSLPAVKMDCVYAGSGVGSNLSVSGVKSMPVGLAMHGGRTPPL